MLVKGEEMNKDGDYIVQKEYSRRGIEVASPFVAQPKVYHFDRIYTWEDQLQSQVKSDIVILLLAEMGIN